MLRAAALLVALTGCEDPVRDRAVSALGPEAAGVPEGPLHRPGQPCVLCHDGEEARALALGGTITWAEGSEVAAVGATVDLVDALGARFSARTNCAGNFFVLPEDYQPQYPVWVSLRRGASEIAMESPIHGDGSCATCHASHQGPESAGPVYLYSLPPSDPPPECP
jgi:hypothetical protein